MRLHELLKIAWSRTRASIGRDLIIALAFGAASYLLLPLYGLIRNNEAAWSEVAPIALGLIAAAVVFVIFFVWNLWLAPKEIAEAHREQAIEARFENARLMHELEALKQKPALSKNEVSNRAILTSAKEAIAAIPLPNPDEARFDLQLEGFLNSIKRVVSKSDYLELRNSLITIDVLYADGDHDYCISSPSQNSDAVDCIFGWLNQYMERMTKSSLNPLFLGRHTRTESSPKDTQ